jgi:5-methylcytosine-specific restriction endonuclease McrA
MESARALTENLAALLSREHHALAEFLVALADFDHRRRWVELGHSSLFYFLHRELGLSKGAAQYRKVAAELIQEVPGVVEPLRQGRLCLTSIIEAAKVVTAENWEMVLPRFYGLSKREALEVVAALQPHPAPPARTVVTALRAAPASRSPASTPPALEVGGAPEPPSIRPEPIRAAGWSDETDPVAVALPAQLAAALELGDASVRPEPIRAAGWPDETDPVAVAPPAPLADAPVAIAPSAASVRPLEVVPLTAEQSRLHATVSSRFMKKLEAACDALSNARPGATPGEILEAGLDLLLAQAAKRRGLVEKPRKEPPAAKADHVPAHVRREVWKRDGGRCQWSLDSGGICGSTRHLELDHVHPRSRGGASTVDNLRILCKAHNDLAARRALGDETMDQFTLGLRGPRHSRVNRANRSEPPATSPP